MKKFKLLVAPLLVLPFVIGCNNGGGDKPEEVKFSLSGNPTLDGKVATVNVDWTPTDSIKFESFTFTATTTKENTATFDQTGDPRPMPVTITFKDDVTEDISGTLKFSYEDVTAKTKGESSLTFTIPKPEPVDPYQVTEDEFNDALSFKNEQYLQIESETETGIGDPMVIAAKASPTVFYSLADTPMPAPFPSFYEETFIAKNEDGSYDKYSKDSKEGNFTKTAGTAEEFKTPQQLSLLEQLTAAGLTYKSFTYDETVKGYTATYTSPTSTEETITTLKFENKKLISETDVVPSVATSSVSTYTYKQETPDLPYVPPVVQYTLTFANTNNCTMQDEDEQPVTSVTVDEGTELAYTLSPNQGFHLPEVNQIDFKITDTETDFTGTTSYDSTTGEISITLTDNVTIYAVGSEITYYTLSFAGTDCKLYYDAEGQEEYEETSFEEGKTFEGYIIPDDTFPIPQNVTYTSGDEPYDPKEASYNPTTGALSITMDADITVTAVSQVLEWYEDENYLSNLTEEDVTKVNPDGSIGEVKTVEVNGQIHKVRLIGVDADVDENGNTCHTTWEFANLLSDSEGYSLATYWLNTGATSGANSDYRDSSVRRALTGEGGGSLNWFQIENKSFSTTYADKTVLEMLPSGLSSVLKTVKKTVNVKVGDAWVPTDVADELFLLSPNELNEQTTCAEESGAYLYYQKAEPGLADPIRIKAQVKGATGARATELSGSDLAGSYVGEKYSYAGYHNTQGAYSWLRSPTTINTEGSWRVGYNGYLNSVNVYNFAYGVAPAFCI